MEFFVYDGLNRKVGLVVSAAMILPVLVVFSLPVQSGTKMPADLYLILAFPVGMTVAMFPVINVMTNVRIRIERATGEIFRIYALFGRVLKQHRYNLSDFDRVGLSRGFRTGYRVSMLGREQDVMVCFSSNLGIARERADSVAAECGLNVSDRL